MVSKPANRKNKNCEKAFIALVAFVFIAFFVSQVSVQNSAAQPADSQSPPSQAQSSSPSSQSASPSTSQSNQDVPDAPSAVQPPAPEPPPPTRPEPQPQGEDGATKPAPVERNPWTNQPVNQPTNEQPANPAGTTPPPTMPPVKTVPPGTTPKQTPQEELYTLKVRTNFVEVPVSVKTKDGRMVDGLLPSDFSVYENNVKQKLTFFTSDPFALSVAIVLDLGMSDAAVQEINQTFPALIGAFAPYDDVALYTYSSTVSQVSGFMQPTQKLTQIFNQTKVDRGRENGVAVLSGPLAPNGPIINNIPMGSPTQPVYTPTKEAHVLNDAILRAALDLRKEGRDRRKVIFVIGDGREYGSQASYRDVLRLLLSNEIQVRGVAVSSGALPIYDKLERLHLPKEGYDDILPKYTWATGGGAPMARLTRNAIGETYAQIMSEARNQYTLGYIPSKPKTTVTSAKREIEVRVDHPGLIVQAKDGYYPAPPGAR
ncbi:MAG TPA: VWA domain-containing protein [Candidatus Aquilonibacter sp.]|nr:VWA domain-containing protein [Candidatus Aquilonibacter sp.]